MLAALNNYFSLWMLPLILLIIAGWLFGGGHLYHRSLKPFNTKKKFPLSKGIIASLLTGMVGGFAAMMMFYCCYKLFGSMIGKIVFGSILGAAAFVVMSILTIYTMKKVEFGDAMKISLKPALCVLLIAAIIGGPTGFFAFKQRMTKVEQDKMLHQSLINLSIIHGQLRTTPNNLPVSLDELVKNAEDKDKKQLGDAIKSPFAPDRNPGFFYFKLENLPRPGETHRDDELIACAFRGTQPDGEVVVLFSNGRVQNLGKGGFETVLDKPINAKFKDKYENSSK